MKRILFLLMLMVALPLQARQATIDGLKISGGPDFARVVFESSGDLQYKYFFLEGPDRLVFDFQDVKLATQLPRGLPGTPLIQRLRSGPRGSDSLRVVVDLKGKVIPQVSESAQAGGKGNQLVVDLFSPGIHTASAKGSLPPVGREITKKPPPPVPAPVKPEGKREPPPQVVKTPEPPAPVAETKPDELVKPVKVRLPDSDGSRDIVVAIDAGHGGKDVGAIGTNGTYEKDVTLSIAKELARKVNRERGMRAVLIRDGDYFLRLPKRVELARKHQADILISIHADAFDKAHVAGASVYTLSKDRASSEAARWLAERENSADLVGGVELKDKDDLLATVLLDLSQAATMQASFDVAESLLRRLDDLGRLHYKEVQKAKFAVLTAPDVPSVLVETAYITNPAEEQKLNSKAYQQELASAILDGVKDYFLTNPPPGTRYAKDIERRRVLEGDAVAGLEPKGESRL